MIGQAGPIIGNAIGEKTVPFFPFVHAYTFTFQMKTSSYQDRLGTSCREMTHFGKNTVYLCRAGCRCDALE